MILGIGAHPVKFIREGKEEELIEKLVEGIRKVVEAFYPRRVWYRTSTPRLTSSASSPAERRSPKRGTRCSAGGGE